MKAPRRNRSLRRASALHAALVGAVACALSAAVASAGTTIVCLGDSLTEGYGVDATQSYPVLLEARLHELGHDVRVVNAGISGSTSASGVSRLRWQLRARPSIVILELGANDGLRGVDLSDTRANLAKTIELAKSNDVRIVLAGMKIPPNYGADYTQAFEQMYGELAEELDVALIPFLLDGVAGDRSLNLADGIHPNAEGYVRVVNNVLPVLLSLL